VGGPAEQGCSGGPCCRQGCPNQVTGRAMSGAAGVLTCSFSACVIVPVVVQY
jgi:hypothetical protein